MKKKEDTLMITYEDAKQLKVGDIVYAVLDKPKRVVEAKVTCCEDRTDVYRQKSPILFLAWRVKNGTIDYSTFLSERASDTELLFLRESDAVKQLIEDYNEKITFYQNKIAELNKLLE